MITSSNAAYKNESSPEWGLGLVVEDQPDNWVLVFEHVGRKKFIKAKAKTLVTVSLAPEVLEQLKAKLHGRHAARAGAKAKAKRKPTKNVARFTTFEEQMKAFERLFPGGFDGDTFVKEERGAPGATGKAGYKAAGIALAQAELQPERFETASPADLFDSAKRVLGATNIVFPIEGAIAFGAVPEEDREATVTSLKQLLHGEGDYGARLEQFAASLSLKDKSGKAKKVTWPLATIFAALYQPAEQTVVKPTVFAAEGATLGLAVEKSQPVTAGGYRQFAKVALETQRRLLEAGYKPRDLVDVYSFIHRTHAEKTAAVEPGPPVEA
jgi:hypothetical protein